MTEKSYQELTDFGKWNRDDLGSGAAGDQHELAGRAVREGEPPKRTQTPCSLALAYRGPAAQVAMVAPTLTGNGYVAVSFLS